MAGPEEILRAGEVRYVLHEHVPASTVAETLVALPFPVEEHVKTLAVDATTCRASGAAVVALAKD